MRAVIINLYYFELTLDRIHKEWALELEDAYANEVEEDPSRSGSFY
jgi:hypothetical protein